MRSKDRSSELIDGFGLWYDVEPNTGCWLWLRSTTARGGYGQVRHKNEYRAHRAMYEIYKGPIPEGMMVLHQCDQPSCVNPDHLSIGTAIQNSTEMVMRGRASSDLTEPDIVAIRSYLGEWRTLKEVGDMYGLSDSPVYAIGEGKTWKHIPIDKNRRIRWVGKTSYVKKDTWREFSKYIRSRDCMKTTGSVEYGTCVTCGKQFPFDRLQAGHFIAGRNNAILFDPRGVHAQCVGCNTFGNGQQPKYYEYMMHHYGQEVIDELFRQANMACKFSENDYKEMRRQFREWKTQIDEIGSFPDEEWFVHVLRKKMGAI